jgi:hypothetical protein
VLTLALSPIVCLSLSIFAGAAIVFVAGRIVLANPTVSLYDI